MTTAQTGEDRDSSPEGEGRRLSLLGWAAIVVVYLTLLQGVTSLVATENSAVDEIQTSKDVFRGYVIPIGTSLLFAIALTSWLGW